MLAAAWVVCGWAVRRFKVPRVPGARIVMGLTAFSCLMLGEMLISIFFSDQSLVEHFGLYREPAAQLGLAGQMLFGLFPLFRNTE